MKTLLRNLSHVLTFDEDDRELTDVDILIDRRQIVAIGHGLPDEGVDRIIDGSGQIALPGLINAHQHLYQGAMRTLPVVERAGLGDFLIAQNSLVLNRWRDGRFTAADVAVTARSVLTESVLGGVTTVADQHTMFPGFPGAKREPYVEATISAAAEVGVRLHAARSSVTYGRAQGGLVDDVFTESIADVIAHAERLISTYHDPDPFAMVRIVLAPSGVVSDLPETFAAHAVLAAQHDGVRLHTHLHQVDDTRFAQAKYGKSPWRVLVDSGCASDRLWVAHMVTAPLEEELEEYVAAGIGIAHIPGGDLKCGFGIAPLRRYLDAGIPMGFATTGSMTNDGANLLGDLRLAALVHRAGNPPEQWPTARELLAMATRGSAAILGRDDLGSLAVGKAADIACWDLTGVDRAGFHDPAAALLFTGISQIAKFVLVNGTVVVAQGVPTLVDPDEVAGKTRALAAADDRTSVSTS